MSEFKTKRIITEDLKYVLFSEIYQRFSEPKARRKAFSIIENAIHCFDRKGFEHVTFLMIARESGLTPPSLRHYFSNLEDIRQIAMKYIHLAAQNIVLKTMEPAKDPKEVLRLYLLGHYMWVVHLKVNYRVWLNFLSYSSTRKNIRQLNTLATHTGTRRIIEILSRGRQAGVFKHEDDYIGARYIQTFILGWLTACVTQDIDQLDEFSKSMMERCMKSFI